MWRNPRSLIVNGLSYVQVDKHGISKITQCRPSHSKLVKVVSVCLPPGKAVIKKMSASSMIMVYLQEMSYFF